MELAQVLRVSERVVLWFLLTVGNVAFIFGQTLLQQPAPEASAHSAVRILSPKNGGVLNVNLVHCKYELVKPATPAEPPAFQLQLDDQEPVHAVETEYTFTGLKEGPHTIVVTVVDANDFPIPGTESEVHFKVIIPIPPPKTGELFPLRASTAPIFASHKE